MIYTCINCGPKQRLIKKDFEGTLVCPVCGWVVKNEKQKESEREQKDKKG